MNARNLLIGLTICLGGCFFRQIDAEGLDLAMRDETARLRFDAPIANVADLQPTLAALARRAREAA